MRKHGYKLKIGSNTHIHVWRKTSRIDGEEGEVAQRGDRASTERVEVPRALVLPVVPDLVNHLRKCIGEMKGDTTMRGNRNITNSMVHEEQRIVGGPFCSWDTGRGSSPVRAEASHITGKFISYKHRTGRTATARLPAKDDMGARVNTLDRRIRTAKKQGEAKLNSH